MYEYECCLRNTSEDLRDAPGIGTMREAIRAI